MQTGALIVAAGKSSRMGDFKPMLQLGSISIAQRVINNFRQAGISKVVVVTGYHADVLECHLASNNVVFLRNENYANTHMFDSVRIGLEYLKDKVDTVLFTPVDVPLFTAQTVTQMLSLGRPLVTPVCNGNPGHPILIRSTLIDSILSDDGKSGLKGAVDNCGEPMYYLNVKDPGIIHDADTPEDYAELLRIHNQSLIIRSQGGTRGSHSELTPYGEEFLKRYARFSEETRSCSKKIFEECFGGFLNA